MTYPKVTFVTDNLLLKAEHICFLAKTIQMGHYQNGGFLILPRLVSGNRRLIHFPDFPYTANFWKEIAKCKNLDYAKPFPQSAVNEVQAHLSKLPGTKSRFEVRDWKAIETNFFNLTTTFFDDWNSVGSVEVLVDDYGTRGSFNVLLASSKYAVHATMRSDIASSQLGRTLLLAMYRLKTKLKLEITDAGWKERVATVDFLMTKTALAKLIPAPKEIPISQDLIDESNKYLDRLGFPRTASVNVDIAKFTNEELALYTTLREKKGVATFDDIASALWKDDVDSKYSLWAISKIVECVRRKIKAQGIHKDTILTHRGRGYSIVL